MATDSRQLAELLAVSGELESSGFSPILIGGMALVVMGSLRVTRDYDLLVSKEGPPTDELVAAMYRRHFELVTKYGPARDVIRTVDSVRVAKLKVRSEKPITVPFYNWKQLMLMDVMMDFPLPAKDLVGRASRVRFPDGSLLLASVDDLRRLKEISYADRKSATDAQDLEFLRKLSR